MKSVKYVDWDRKRQLLEKLDLFKDFSRFDIPKVAELYDQILFFNKNERIIRQGASDDCFYILLSGSARVCKGDNPETIVNIQAGDFFGEISYLSRSRRTRHVFANEKTFALKLTHEMLDRLEAEIREVIKDKLMNKLVERVVRAAMEDTHT